MTTCMFFTQFDQYLVLLLSSRDPSNCSDNCNIIIINSTMYKSQYKALHDVYTESVSAVFCSCLCDRTVRFYINQYSYLHSSCTSLCITHTIHAKPQPDVYFSASSPYRHSVGVYVHSSTSHMTFNHHLSSSPAHFPPADP